MISSVRMCNRFVKSHNARISVEKDELDSYDLRMGIEEVERTLFHDRQQCHPLSRQSKIHRVHWRP